MELKEKLIEEVKYEDAKNLMEQAANSQMELLVRKNQLQNAQIEIKHLESKLKFMRETEIKILIEKVDIMKREYEKLDSQIKKIILKDETKII